MKFILSILFICLINLSFAQINLIPNPSFELYDTCPNVLTTNYPNGTLKFWYNPSQGSPDYYNVCAGLSGSGVPNNFLGGGGFQYPNSGSAYTGIAMYVGWSPNQREYWQIMLLDSLKKDSLYKLEFYVNLQNTMMFSINEFDVFFSDTAYINTSTFQVFPITPQIKHIKATCVSDTLNWILIRNYFIANGGEKFLTFGSFTPDSVLGICNNTFGTFNAAYYYYDDFYLGRVSDTTGILEQKNEILFRIYPNPSSGLVYLNINTTDNENLSIKLYDLCSKVLHNERLQQGKASYTFDFSHLSKGIYCFTLFKNNKPVSSQRLVINR